MEAVLIPTLQLIVVFVQCFLLLHQGVLVVFLYRIEIDLEALGVAMPTEEENNWHVGLKEEETKCGGLSTIFFCGLWFALHRRQNNLLISPA